MTIPPATLGKNVSLPTMPLRVLILEDLETDADLMVDELNQAGFNLIWQRIQTKADYLTHLDPALDLILSDHNLPQFDALSALRILKERNLDIPFIIVSGLIDEELAVAAIKLGADDYVMKDRLGRLGSAVMGALKTRELRLQKQQTERRLQESEAKFRFLAEHAQDIIYRLELFPTPHLSYISSAVERISGFSPEEHYADPMLILKVLHPDHLPMLRSMIDDLRAGMTLAKSYAEQFEMRWVTKDNRLLWLEQQNAGIYDDQGQCIAIVGVARDITERKRSEEERHKLLRAIEQSPASIVITDVRGSIEYVNPKFVEITGYTAAEAKGQNPRILKSGETQPGEYEQMWKTITSGKEWRGEFHNKTKTGDLYWESASISPIYNDLGEITHFLAVKEDISERKRREQLQEALLASANILRAATTRADMLAAILRQVASLLDASFTCVVSTQASADALLAKMHDGQDDDLIIEATYYHQARPQGGDLIGMRLPATNNICAEVNRTGIPQLHQNPQHDPFMQRLAWAGAGQNIACIPLRTQDESIGVLWVVRNTPLLVNDLRVLTAIADMTASGLQRVTLHDRLVRHAANLEQEVAARTQELRAANEHLLELDRLKSKFVADVSHELRTPVTNMGLYLQLLKAKPEKSEHYMTVLLEQAEHLQTLVKAVLDLSRLDNVKQVAMLPVHLNELITHVVKAHQAQAESHDLDLTFTPDPDLPLAHGNAHNLVQIFTNLVTNAINYTNRGSIRVRTLVAQSNPPPNKIMVEVSDTGLGIYPEDIAHLFDRFYRGKQDRASIVPGAGLGLSIVKELVELHQGTISVQSQPGLGTTFTVTLPATLPDTEIDAKADEKRVEKAEATGVKRREVKPRKKTALKVE